MPVFDPVAMRKGLQEVVLPMELDEQIESYQPNAVGNAAIQRLHAVIEAWLVGLECEFRPVLKSTKEWLVSSLQVNEEFGMNERYHESQKWEALALCEWMLTGQTCKESLEKALTAKEQAWALEQRYRGEASAQNLVKADLPDYIAICLQLKQAALGVAQSNRHGITPAHSEDLKFSLFACESWDNEASTYVAFSASWAKFLTKKLQGEWLAHGQSIRAATWLKTLLWRDGSPLSPISTLRLAYDYMPNVRAPST